MIYIATDHAGFELKNIILENLKSQGLEIEDCGAYEYNPDDDYPDFIGKAAEAVSRDPENNKGIVIGGSGQAEMITANKYQGVRCGLFYKPAVPVGAADIQGRVSDDPFEIVRLTREHNNTNMLSLSSRFLSQEDALKAIKLWLDTPFGGGRHERRVEKITKIEKELRK